MRRYIVLFIAVCWLLMICQHPANATEGTIEGWSYEGHSDGIPDSLAGPFISVYDGVCIAELGPNGEAVWEKDTEGSGWLRKDLQIPPLPSGNGKVYLTFWYDWVAVMEDGVPPGGMEIFLAGKSRFRLEPTPGYIDPMIKWDVSEYAGKTVPFAIKYWFKIISHGFGPTTGFWAEFIGVSLNMVEAQGWEEWEELERNTSEEKLSEERSSMRVSGESEIVVRNDQQEIKKGEEFYLNIFGEISGVVWFVPVVDPALRIPHQTDEAYSAKVKLIPQQRYEVTEQYEIALTSLGMVGTVHPVSDSYWYWPDKMDNQFVVVWTISNLSVEVFGDIEGSKSDLTANWIRVKVKAKRDIKLGELVRGKVKYSATWMKISSIR